MVEERFFPDHHVYTAGEVEELLSAANSAGAVAVTTAKDATKLPPGAPLWVLEVDVQPVDGSWDRLWQLTRLPGV